jgi:hypothetical protein
MNKVNHNIEAWIKEYESGFTIYSIAKRHNVAVGSVRYQIFKERDTWKAQHIIIKPMCYKDYLNNQIIRMEMKLKQGAYPKDREIFIVSEIKKLRFQLGINRSKYPISAFILQ